MVKKKNNYVDTHDVRCLHEEVIIQFEERKCAV